MEYGTFHRWKADKLSQEQKKKEANNINLIKKINLVHTSTNPAIRACSCYNGQVQRGIYTKEETAALTCSHDSFFIMSIKDAFDGHDVAVTDVK